MRRGKWRCCVRNLQNGQLHELTTGGVDAADSLAAAVAWIAEQAAPEPEPKTLRAAAEEWLAVQRTRPSTAEDYRRSLLGIAVPILGGRLEIGRVTHQDILRLLHALYAQRGNGPKTIRARLAIVRALFRWAQRCHYCAEDPTEGVRAPRVPRYQGRVLTRDEAGRLLAASRSCVDDGRGIPGHTGGRTGSTGQPGALFVALLTALHTGLRQTNVYRMRWEWFRADLQWVTIPAANMKTGEAFSTPIHPELAEVLGRLRTARFAGDGGGVGGFVLGREVRDMSRAFKGALCRAGLPRIRWHDLRHTAATWWGEQLPHAVCQRLMGHAPADMTYHYTHIPEAVLEAAVRAMPHLLPAR